jgi:hypothetical protein
MRDTNEGMIEIIEAFKEGDRYFAIVEVPKNREKEKFRFGITANGYRALKKIFQFRPFNTMPGMKYRYFYDGSMSIPLGHNTDESIFLGIRCEIDIVGKSFDFQVPQDLASNLEWFSKLETFDEAEHLRIKT